LTYSDEEVFTTTHILAIAKSVKAFWG
jgi:hypothetical protein